MSAAFIALDTESGGLLEDSSLLTACFVVLDNNLNELDKLELAIKPDKDESYHVTAEALSVNGINLIEHEKVATSATEAAQKLLEFLRLHSNDGKVKLVPIGHNVAYDLILIDNKLVRKRHYEKYISYRKLDTGTILQFLKLSGKVPSEIKGGLGEAAKHFGIEFEGQAHTAYADTKMCIELLKRLKGLV